MSIDSCLQRGCLGTLLVFGCLILLYLFTTYSAMGGEEPNQENNHPFEIITKHGTVTLHLGMPKDSVIMLVGKPDNIQSHSDYDNDIIEELEYKIKSQDFDLSFTFENGKLRDFNQY